MKFQAIYRFQFLQNITDAQNMFFIGIFSQNIHHGNDARFLVCHVPHLPYCEYNTLYIFLHIGLFKMYSDKRSYEYGTEDIFYDHRY